MAQPQIIHPDPSDRKRAHPIEIRSGNRLTPGDVGELRRAYRDWSISGYRFVRSEGRHSGVVIEVGSGRQDR